MKIADTSNISVIADLEGAIGVDDVTACAPCKNSRLTEATTLISELQKHGDFEVFYCDCHTGMMWDAISSISNAEITGALKKLL